LIPKGGGTLAIDGIQVTAEEPSFPAFKKSQSYLLFISLDQERKIGRLDLGQTGVLPVNADGTLDSIDKLPQPLKRDIQNRYGSSLQRMKEGLKHRPAKS
jgi:hypothetical protein